MDVDIKLDARMGIAITTEGGVGRIPIGAVLKYVAPRLEMVKTHRSAELEPTIGFHPLTIILPQNSRTFFQEAQDSMGWLTHGWELLNVQGNMISVAPVIKEFASEIGPACCEEHQEIFTAAREREAAGTPVNKMLVLWAYRVITFPIISLFTGLAMAFGGMSYAFKKITTELIAQDFKLR